MLINENKLLMAWPNRVDEGTLSGGSFLSTLPLVNAKNRVLSKKARTTNTQLSSTQFQMSFTVPNQIDVIAVLAHNLSTSAKIRFIWYENTEIVHDSGFYDVWPALSSSDDLEWEYNNYWTMGVGEDQISDYTPVTFYVANSETILVPTAIVVEIQDQDNIDGYVEIGRLFCGKAYQPNLNMQLGAQLGYQIDTTSETALNGTEYFDIKTPKRTVTFTLDALTENEAHSTLYRMQRTQGIHAEIFFTYKAQPSVNQYNRTFVGRLEKPDPISQPYNDRYQTSITLVEIL